MCKTKMAALLTLIAFLLSAGCGIGRNQEQDRTAMPEKIVIQAPMAPPTTPLYKFAKDGDLNGAKMELIIYKSVEEATTRVAKGEADFTVLPLNVAAKLYNKQMDISLANVSTWGILYLLTTDSQSADWQDLKGKELYVGAQGSSPDVLTQYFIWHNSEIKAGEIKLAYLNSPEIAQLMINGLAEYAVLPEPQATQVLMNNSQARRIRDFYEDWQVFEGKDVKLPQAGMVVRNEFVRLYPKAVTDFQNAYKSAIEWTVANKAEAAPLAVSYMDIPEPVFIKSMEKTRLFFMSGWEAREDVNIYLSRLLDISPDMVGGKIPDEKFYLAD
ncbi:MAG: ABC transporter substrate-binding protein [Desulfotomaculaceae bacterium]|nr:ABC transporter substrate-binding protein [Desulfotomaculaceae bacterium]MDD4767866.1 ABC transporter substrate-binding protein [Desulfotomaculaceae bacterium]